MWNGARLGLCGSGTKCFFVRILGCPLGIVDYGEEAPFLGPKRSLIFLNMDLVKSIMSVLLAARRLPRITTKIIFDALEGGRTHRRLAVSTLVSG